MYKIYLLIFLIKAMEIRKAHGNISADKSPKVIDGKKRRTEIAVCINSSNLEF